MAVRKLDLAALTKRVAMLRGFPSAAAYERAVIRKAVVRDARRLGLLDNLRKRRARR